MRQLILASQSPRRKELLGRMGLDFEVVPSEFDERLDDSRSPQDVAMELALGKAREVADKYPEAIVIGADTIVYYSGRQLGKPTDEADAVAMLSALSGHSHEVCTGVTVLCRAARIENVAVDTAHVRMRKVAQSEIEAYVAAGEPMDKAGGYGIQAGGKFLVESVDGNVDTIIGLPTKLLADMLHEIGVYATPVEIKL